MSHYGRRSGIQAATFLIFLALITIAFTASILPFLGAILWSIVAGIMFRPLYRWLLGRVGDRRSAAAGLTLLVIAAAIITPMILLGGYFVEEAAGLFQQVQSRQIDYGALFTRVHQALPDWLARLVDEGGITDLNSLIDKVSREIASRAQSLIGTVVNVGQGLASFLLSLAVTLYLTFFLLRDGRELNDAVGSAVPMEPTIRHQLAERFVTVVRATVKGSIVVGIAQGALGGIVMAILGVPNSLLWGVVMAFASLLPAVGTGLVWVPVSLYLIAVGDIWQAIAMVLAGLFVIGSVDNVLRPILVGRQTQMPDFVVLITTLGGLSTFGFNGLLIGPVAAALFMSAWEILRKDSAGTIADAPSDQPSASPRT